MHTEIYCFGWWMGAYGGKSPKRHRGFSNNAFSSRLDLGVFRRAQQAKQKQIQTTKRYQKRNGEFGYVGTKQLKGTQPGPYMIGLQEFYWFPSHGMFGFFILYKFIRMDMFRRRTLYIGWDHFWSYPASNEFVLILSMSPLYTSDFPFPGYIREPSQNGYVFSSMSLFSMEKGNLRSKTLRTILMQGQLNLNHLIGVIGKRQVLWDPFGMHVATTDWMFPRSGNLLFLLLLKS